MRTISDSIGLPQAAFMIFMSFMVHSSVGAQQKPPVFRARTDLLQLDVTVLDKDGKPVRGLTKEDFALLEDNVPQAIEGFTAVDVADVVREGPVWSHTATPDVTTNEIDNQRIFVLVVDDARGMGLMEMPPARGPDPWAVRRMKESVTLFISQLGPEDLVALVFTQRTRLSENLTDDHARLIKTVQSFPDGGGSDLVGSGPAGCLGARYSVGMIKGVVNQLATVPDRRKAIVYFGGEMPGVPLSPGSDAL
jgi:VWFA-related protein